MARAALAHAPEHVLDAAIPENVFAGNAMSRRLQWQYAVLMLRRVPFGHVDQAIGRNIAKGATGLIAPNLIIVKGRELMREGKYLHATEILNRLVFAEPRNLPARQLLADAFEQIGYQAESTSVRNTFLQGAFELRNGQPGGVPPRSTGPDVVRAMSTEQWLDFIGISLDPKRAEGLKFTINLVTPDTGERYAIEMSNATPPEPFEVTERIDPD